MVVDLEKNQRAFDKLKKAIHGRDGDSYINPDYKKPKKPKDFILLKIYLKEDDGFIRDVSFSVQDDCRCEAISRFLESAKIDNLSLATGPRKGQRKVLGINGEFIKGFYAYQS